MKIIISIIRFLASLRLAVILIALYAATIAWASFLESIHGAAAARFAIYGTLWFLTLNVVLAVNVLFAALVRFPWRRRQTGFVITHAGILVLMAGCLISWSAGIDARMPLAEGRKSGRAYCDAHHIDLKIGANDASREEDGSAGKDTQIPFVGGPFNWEDYHRKLFWFPWCLGRCSQGVLYDRDGVRLEAIDYIASEQAPRVRLRMSLDEKIEEFWLEGSMDEQMQEDQRRIMESSKRRAIVTMPQDAVDLGFLVYLKKFLGKLEPGSGMASNYSSLVDFVARDEINSVLQENVTITLNAPVDFADPVTGRTWRLFQAGFDGPWKPGSRQFEALAGGDRSRDQIYLSVFTLSYDPGRALKYIGSLLIVVGIAIVYYFRVQGSGCRIHDLKQ